MNGKEYTTVNPLETLQLKAVVQTVKSIFNPSIKFLWASLEDCIGEMLHF